MDRIDNGKKIFAFAALHEKAKVIAEVAADFPGGDIEVEVTPMRTPDEAEDVCRRVFRKIGTTGAGGRDRDSEAIRERYRGLSKGGMASMVELSVPDGEDFDFLAFHQKVDGLLKRENANKPKVL